MKAYASTTLTDCYDWNLSFRVSQPVERPVEISLLQNYTDSSSTIQIMGVPSYIINLIMSEGEDSYPNKPYYRQPNEDQHLGQKLRKDIAVEICSKNRSIKQLVQNVDLSNTLNDQHEIVLHKLLDKLKQHYNFPIENHEIFYYLPEGDIYMNCGNDPINQDVTISPQDYLKFNKLTIRTKQVNISLIHKLMSEEVNETMMQERENQEGENNESNKCRRTKERRIGYIIDKVVKWRQYYTGVKEGPAETTKRYSLEDAATKVGISKKSLDDYLLQIRFGRKYGFNFNQHKNDKVGVLRDYVRKNKKSNNKPDKKVKKAERKQKEEDSNE